MKKILSMTKDEFNKISLNEILLMLKDNIDEVSKFGDDYTISIASSIVKKVFSLRDNYDKFYKIIFSLDFRDNKYIVSSLEKDNFINLKKLLDIYKENSKLVDFIFINDKALFDEIVFKTDYNIDDVFSNNLINSFNNKSYRKLLSYLLKDSVRSRVVRSLIKEKNEKFVYMVSKMDDVILSYVNDDSSYFDAVLTMLNYNNYRHLLWDYYNKYVVNERNKAVLESSKYSMVVADEMKELLNYTFGLVNIIYSDEVLPEIITSMDELIKSFNSGKDMVHKAVFGIEGYKKVKDGTFDVLVDFPKINSENQFMNLKIAFFNTIYGLTYEQVGKIINNFDSFMKVNKISFKESDRLVYETVIAMKSLYNLTIDCKNEIDLYRKVYYKYISKNGIYSTVEVEALVIMEDLMRRMYNNSIEML